MKSVIERANDLLSKRGAKTIATILRERPTTTKEDAKSELKRIYPKENSTKISKKLSHLRGLGFIE